MPKPLAFYPEFQRLMEEAWQDLERRLGRHVSLWEARELARAKKKQLSPSSLSSYRRGRELPDTDNLNLLGRLFYPEDMSRQEKFRTSVRGAGRPKPAAGLIDPFDSLAVGARPIRVGVVNYGPYAWEDEAPRGGFFDQFFRMFVGCAALGGEKGSQFKQVAFDRVLEDLCVQGSIDVVLAILATPDRAMMMKFFLTPITIHVNAVARTEILDRKRESIADALVNPSGPSPMQRVELRPIVDELEVGGLHVKNYLRYKPQDYCKVEFNINDYVNQLLETGSDDKLVRVVVADELTCLRVIAECDKRKQNTGLVFGQAEPQAGSLSPLLPRYRLGFAVNRDHRKWIEFLTEAFPYFLEANAEVMVDFYMRLQNRLLSILGNGENGRQNKEKCVLEWLGDKLALPQTDPWYHILERWKNVRKENEGSGSAPKNIEP
jgi:hypothetical protein